MADLSMDDYSEYSENDSPQPVKIKVIILFNSIIISRYVRVVGYVIYKKERERIRERIFLGNVHHVFCSFFDAIFISLASRALVYTC
jgi:hypothetical protein